MLISEIKGWHWVITWDNPDPPDSSGMLKALGTLGNLTDVETKTTVVLAPKSGVGPTQIRQAIVGSMNSSKGRAVYVNLRSGKAFEWDAASGSKWRSIT